MAYGAFVLVALVYMVITGLAAGFDSGCVIWVHLLVKNLSLRRWFIIILYMYIYYAPSNWPYRVCTVERSRYVTVTQSEEVVVYYTTSTLCWDLWKFFYCDETRFANSRCDYAPTISVHVRTLCLDALQLMEF